jgi:hypothetical protein
MSVPANYPSDLSSTFILKLLPVTPVTCTVTVKKGTTAIQGARVDAIDGTDDAAPQGYVTGTTNSFGQVTLTLPVTPTGSPGDYDIKAWGKLGTTAVYGGLTNQKVPATSCAFAVSAS